MKILAIEREIPGTNSEHFTPHLKDEAIHVYDLYKNGIIREIYFHKNESSAVLIMECENQDDARKYLDEFPLVKNHLIEFEIIPLIPYPGFDRILTNL
jgi:hypothetical protein